MAGLTVLKLSGKWTQMNTDKIELCKIQIVVRISIPISHPCLSVSIRGSDSFNFV
jgi:hypothetical protein